jgi:hypothetical protein
MAGSQLFEDVSLSPALGSPHRNPQRGVHTLSLEDMEVESGRIPKSVERRGSRALRALRFNGCQWAHTAHACLNEA